MKLKQKLLLALVASILATPTAFAVYTLDTVPTENTDSTSDDARDIQNVTVNVPEVALIDIEATTGPAFTFVEPTQAGAGLTIPAPNTDSKLKYSSNVAAGARNITLSIDTLTAANLTALPANMTLGISTATPGTGGGTAAACTLTGSTFTGCVTGGAGNLITGITNHASNVTAATGYTITYTPGLVSTESMIGHTGGTNKTLKLVYTLGTEG